MLVCVASRPVFGWRRIGVTDDTETLVELQLRLEPITLTDEQLKGLDLVLEAYGKTSKATAVYAEAYACGGDRCAGQPARVLPVVS